ncbi:MAG: calcium-binding protein [Alphaproteobacteria bacterium]|nr:calcium-binding protein [Alphaproteobacteria bacterium]
MIINYFGGNNAFFSDAFLDAGGYNVTVSSATGTEVVLVQATTGQRTTITGTGLVFDGNGVLVEAGTITGISFQDSGLTTLATFSGMSWDMGLLHQALLDEAAGNSTGLSALFAGQVNVLDLGAAMGVGPSGFFNLSGMDAYLINNTTEIIGSPGPDFLNAANNNRGILISAGDGDDILSSGSGNDTLNGEAGNDTLKSNAGDDTLNGGEGNDILQGGYGDDILNGGAGDDTLQGFYGNNILNGGAGADWLAGYVGVDILTGGSGADIFSIFWFGYAGDTITDLEAGETIQMTAIGESVEPSSWTAVTERSIATTIVGADLNLGVDVDGDGTTDVTFTLSGYAGIAGSFATVMLPEYTSFGSNLNNSTGGLSLELFFVPDTGIMPVSTGGADKLFGTSGSNIMSGAFGDDIINGMGGNDTLNGDDGNDRMVGGLGNDILNGGAGADYLFGSEGKDTLNGDGGDDGLYGGAGKDVLDGGDGADQVHGNNGNDLLCGGIGSDYLYGGLGADRIYGGNDSDVLYAGLKIIGQDTSSNWLYGEGGNDTLLGDYGIDRLSGGDGNDDLLGYLGNDLLYGGRE